MKQVYISCPNCGWEPDGGAYWMCSDCKTVWNTFDTAAECPRCSRQYDVTLCPGRHGGCGQVTPHRDWYAEIETPNPKPLSERLMFWKKKYQPPVTTADKQWIEESLLWLAEVFDPIYFKTLPTITPDRHYFDYNFNHTEEDADFILKRLMDLMNIDGWEIGLMFFSEEATEFSEGLRTTRSGKLKDRWSS